MLETIYNINNFPFSELLEIKTKRIRKSEYIINYFMTFDIETTTIETEKNNKEKYIEQPFSFMYHWQICLQGKVIFGRTWEEFLQFMHNLQNFLNLNSNYRLICYVHNLAYEFQFLKDFCTISEMFARGKRKPVKFLVGGIEFRCSYFLSNMSLQKFCEQSKNCIHFKKVDTYDYKKIRFYDTPLTEEEQEYCFNDVKGLYECIEGLLIDDDLTTIPLTSTGYVRRDCRQAMSKNKLNRIEFEQNKLTLEQYELCKKIFRGGNCHTSRFLCNKIINSFSFDISSSYPYVMLDGYYPVSAFKYIDFQTEKEFEYYINNYCVIMEIEFFDISTEQAIPYIDIAHCEKRSGVINDNGRVLKADYISISLTEIDFQIMKDTYNDKNFAVKKPFYAIRGKLSKELRETVLLYYKDKTQLKGIEEQYYFYMKQKNKLNSCFGMLVTDITQDDVIYNNITAEWEEVKADKQKALDKYYKNRKSFLQYQQGIYVTAQARKRLQDILNQLPQKDIIYVDTDSIKFRHSENFKYFLEVNKKIYEKQTDLPLFVERDNKKYYLGVWDYEGKFKIKALGAKKYCTLKKGKFETTVAGMSKKLGSIAVGNIYNFNIGETYENVGRTVAYYNEHKPYYLTLNGKRFLTASNIGIVDTTYTLGITNEYFEIITEYL